MKKLRVAVVGMGLQGQRLLKAVSASSKAVLAATASEREKGSFEAVLADKTIDAVIIATPNHKHRAQVVAAAKAGKHILCEKPLALSAQEGRKVLAAVKKYGVQCFINYHLRTHPEVLHAKKIIAQGKLGDIVAAEALWAIGNYGEKKLPPLPAHMRWRESVAAGGGTTSTRGVHLFDLVRFLTGKEAREIAGWSNGTRTKVDQTAVTLIELEGSIPVTAVTSKMMPNTDNHITLYGTKNKLVLRDVFEADPHAMYAKMFDYLVDAVRGKKTPLATVEDGIAADAITEAFRRAASGGRGTSR